MPSLRPSPLPGIASSLSWEIFAHPSRLSPAITCFRKPFLTPTRLGWGVPRVFPLPPLCVCVCCCVIVLYCNFLTICLFPPVDCKLLKGPYRLPQGPPSAQHGAQHPAGPLHAQSAVLCSVTGHAEAQTLLIHKASTCHQSLDFEALYWVCI